jgi:uncharacterized protein YdcH (DUF465 family)
MRQADDFGRSVMIERILIIIVRFPENEEAVRELIRDDRDFDALCQEYADIGKEIEDLAKLEGPDVAVQTEGLRQRRMAIEEELLTAIEGYRPA